VRHAKVKEPSGVSGDHEAAPATSTLQLKTAMTQQKPPSENHKASKNEEVLLEIKFVFASPSPRLPYRATR